MLEDIFLKTQITDNIKEETFHLITLHANSILKQHIKH